MISKMCIRDRSESALLKVTDVLTTKDKKKVISFGDADGNATTGVVFTIRNLSLIHISAGVRGLSIRYRLRFSFRLLCFTANLGLPCIFPLS